MSFGSIEFYVFFALVLGVYALLPHRKQNVWLLIASYAFYASWNPWFVSLLLLTTLVNYYCGLRIGDTSDERTKKAFLAAGIGANILVLAVFKYGNSFIRGYNTVLSAWPGGADRMLAWRIVFPLGISFYIFQSLAYVIDVYRGHIRPTGRLLDHALYISFFPQLLAGPIERPDRFLPQIQQPRRMTAENFATGIHLIAWGLFLKLFVSDSCALIAERFLADPRQRSGGELLAGVYAFAFHFFANIAGYTDIARGTAKCLGFDLTVNFRLPYFATNIPDFWRRWHISVTSWFRDYVYFPLLAATRGNAWLGAFVTLFFISVWHGLSVNDILRGVYFGSAVVLYHLLKKLLRRADGGVPGHPVLRRARLFAAGLLTFHVICAGWLFFLIPDAGAIPVILGRIAADLHPGQLARCLALPARYVAPLLAVHIVQAATGDEFFILRQRFWVKALFYWALFMLVYGAGGGTLFRPFIYFRY